MLLHSRIGTKRLGVILSLAHASCLALTPSPAAADGGLYDLFVVSLTPENFYWNQMAGGATGGTLVDPITALNPGGAAVIDTATPLGGTAWAWGGADRGDGVQDMHPEFTPSTITLTGEPGPYFLSAVLDTLTGPHADTNYPSTAVMWIEVRPIIDGVLMPRIPPAWFVSPDDGLGGAGTGWLVSQDNVSGVWFGQVSDPETGTQNMGIYGAGTLLPPVFGGDGDPTNDGYAVTITPHFMLTWDSYRPATCAPAGAPFHVQTYEVVGDANDTPWSWRIRATDGTIEDLENLNVPGVPVGGTALEVAEAFADSINAARDAHGCTAVQLSAQAANVFGTVILSITAGGGTPFDLFVGAAGSDPDCMVTTSLPACTFNPSIDEIALPGNDCNENGFDDFVDILAGTSLDANANGVPDECECPADLDGSDAVGFGDLLQLLGAWGPCPACPEDLDGDDAVGFGDLLVLLGAWGPC